MEGAKILLRKNNQIPKDKYWILPYSWNLKQETEKEAERIVIAVVWKGRKGWEKEDGGLNVPRLSPEKFSLYGDHK